MKKDCTILVGSCDSYSDIWDPFFYLLTKFWPDMPYEVVLSTETKDYHSDLLDIKNIHPKDPNCSWTERIKYTVNQIDSDYILFFLDDFFLSDYVDTKKVAKTIEYLKANLNIATFTFFPILNDGLSCDYPGFVKRPQNAKYKVAAIIGIWNKKKLLKYLNKKENAWQWEVNATKRSNAFYNNDEFYVTEVGSKPIFPYDFTKYGLFSGRWMKDTCELFKKENISFDFNKRGFYNEAIKGMLPSIMATFEMDSAIIANYDLTHEGSSYYKCKNIVKRGHFIQKYKIKGARSIIKWQVANNNGFGIDNLKITIRYMDKKISTVNYNKLYGNFVLMDKKFVFNTPDPFMYILTEKDKLIDTIEISGDILLPLDESTLKKSFKKTTLPKEEIVTIEQQLYREFLITKEMRSFFKVKSSMKFLSKSDKVISEMIYPKKFGSGKFKQEYNIPKGTTKVSWIAGLDACFEISDLKFKFIFKNGKKKVIPHSQITGLPPRFGDRYIFVELITMGINIPSRDIESIIITGNIIIPMSSNNFRKLVYPE